MKKDTATICMGIILFWMWVAVVLRAAHIISNITGACILAFCLGCLGAVLIEQHA
jgi:hypothetical protein